MAFFTQLCNTKLCNPRGDEVDADSVKILNTMASMDSNLKRVPEGRTFSLFSSLPKELRLKIWEEVTPRERVVHVYIGLHGKEHCEAMGVPEHPVRYLEKNHLGNPISSSPYWLLHDDPRLHHPLLTVNREARKVVLDFYRIQIPVWCLSKRGSCPNWQEHGDRMTFFFNPEHDVLKVAAGEPVSRTLIDFLWDMKAYDPRGVGLLKLATDLWAFCDNDLQYLKRSDLLLIRQRQALVETLSQLQEVWFINTEPIKKGYVHTIYGTRSQILDLPFGQKAVRFENVGPETMEGAEAALQSVYMGMIDPRELVWRWRRLLRTWKIHYPPGQVKYRVIMARRQFPGDYGKDVGKLTRVMDALTLGTRRVDRRAKDGVVGCCAFEAGGSSLPDDVLPEGPGTCANAPVGFWSFPIEALGEIGEDESLSQMDFEPDRVADMRSYWPELLVTKMI